MARDEPVERGARRGSIDTPQGHTRLKKLKIGEDLQRAIDDIRLGQARSVVRACGIGAWLTDGDGGLQQELLVVEKPEVRHHHGDESIRFLGDRVTLPLANRSDESIAQRSIRCFAPRMRADHDR